MGEDMGIADHFAVPALIGDSDPCSAVIPMPVQEIVTVSVSDTVAPFMTSIMGTVAIAKEHMVPAIRIKHVGARLRLIGFHHTLNQIFVQLVPIQAIL